MDNIKIVKYIDYCYLNNYVNNIILSKPLNDSLIIFDDIKHDEKVNILYFLNSLKKLSIINPQYNFECILNTIVIFEKICIESAHQFTAYTYLFATVYAVIYANSYTDNNFSCEFLTKVIKVNLNLANSMIECVSKYIKNIDIFDKDKLNIISSLSLDF